jgi:hypothetical protein
LLLLFLQEEYPQLRDGILTKLAENFSQIRNSASAVALALSLCVSHWRRL